MIIHVDFIIEESKPFVFMRLKESDFSIGRGQQIDDSFYHFGSKRRSSLREVLSLKGVFPARNWQKEITFLTYYPFYIYVQPNNKYIHMTYFRNFTTIPFLKHFQTNFVTETLFWDQNFLYQDPQKTGTSIDRQ